MNLTLRTLTLIVLIPLVVSPAGARAGDTLDDLSWMAGYWKQAEDGKVNIECWFAPANGVMLGVHQDVFESGKVFFEYLRIVETAGGGVYYAAPGGKEPTAFRLTSSAVESSVKEAVFENPERDFPVLIKYTLDAKGTLTATIEGRDGASRSWTWQRAEFPGAKR